MTTFGTCTEIHNWWAQDKGLYAKYGLDIEQVRGVGGAANLAAVVSGAVDFGFVNGFTAIQAYAQGFAIQVVANVNVTGTRPRPGIQPGQALTTKEDVFASGMGIWVKRDSPITTAADLKGKKVGVNEVGGLNQIVTSAWLKKQGVDPTDVRFVALPFPQLVPAVLQGTIDATQIPAGNVPTASYSQVRSVADPFVELGQKVMLAGYVASKDFVTKNPKAAEGFFNAVRDSITQIQANPTQAIEVLAKGCKGDVNILKTFPNQGVEAEVDQVMLESMAQFMVEQGLLGAKPDVSNLVAASARKK